MKTVQLASGALLALAASLAHAGTPVVGRLPEPETLALFGIAAAAAIIVRLRKRK